MPKKKSQPAKKPEEKRPVGRPPELTPEIRKKICLAIIAGAYIETAAVMVGISKSIFYEWLKKGNKQDSGMYREFVDAVERAVAEAEFRDVALIDQAAHGSRAIVLMEKDAEGKDTNRPVLDGDGKPIVLMPAIKREWTAAAWKLERKFPKKWGRKDRLEVSDAPDRDSIDAMTPEEREREIAETQRKLAELDD